MIFPSKNGRIKINMTLTACHGFHHTVKKTDHKKFDGDFTTPSKHHKKGYLKEKQILPLSHEYLMSYKEVLSCKKYLWGYQNALPSHCIELVGWIFLY